MKSNSIKIILSGLIVALLVIGICVIKTKQKTTDIYTLVYENTVSPNEKFIENSEDKIIYNISVYQNKKTVKVVSSSNSAFFEDVVYEFDIKNKITEADVKTDWQTIMGATDFSKDDQIAVAVVTIYSKGEVVSKRKISFINGAVDIIEDIIEDSIKNK